MKNEWLYLSVRKDTNIYTMRYVNMNCVYMVDTANRTLHFTNGEWRIYHPLCEIKIKKYILWGENEQ